MGVGVADGVGASVSSNPVRYPGFCTTTLRIGGTCRMLGMAPSWLLAGTSRAAHHACQTTIGLANSAGKPCRSVWAKKRSADAASTTKQ